MTLSRISCCLTVSEDEGSITHNIKASNSNIQTKLAKSFSYLGQLRYTGLHLDLIRIKEDVQPS